MRIGFMGTPEIAAATLRAVAQAGHEVALVVTQPDRVRARGKTATPTPVKAAAIELGLPVAEPAQLDAAAVAAIRHAAPEALVVVAYGALLPQEVLAIPRLGCVNAHASLLPRHRGAAPVAWAILCGDAVTGVTTMLMDEGMDTGPMLLKREVAIAPEDTAGTLLDRLAPVAAELMVETLAGLATATIVPAPQDAGLATYAPKLRKEDGAIDWTRSAQELERRVRAYQPWPGSYFELAGCVTRVTAARAEPGAGSEPGTVLAIDKSGLVIACGSGSLRLLELQPAGKRRMSACDFLAGRGLKLKACLADQ